jgi:ankyrin repeat protein
MASQNGHLEVVKALVGANAEVDAKADNGATALIVASQLGRLEVVQALLAAKADVSSSKLCLASYIYGPSPGLAIVQHQLRWLMAQI